MIDMDVQNWTSEVANNKGIKNKIELANKPIVGVTIGTNKAAYRLKKSQIGCYLNFMP